MSKKAKASSNIIAEIPWNDGTGDKVYVNYNPNEKSQTINIYPVSYTHLKLFSFIKDTWYSINIHGYQVSNY